MCAIWFTMSCNNERMPIRLHHIYLESLIFITSLCNWLILSIVNARLNQQLSWKWGDVYKLEFIYQCFRQVGFQKLYSYFTCLEKVLISVIIKAVIISVEDETYIVSLFIDIDMRIKTCETISFVCLNAN